ncbi:MAG: DeoR/GlpR transcriptional regulator [Lentisphaeria bacterium]|nr:DeoR/GlpR transcriptional regulator [Lentisphaeria bacterium]
MGTLGGVRRREMLEVIRREGHCTMGELCERFGISLATVHRDTQALVLDHEVRKVHGGVEYVDPALRDGPWNSAFETRIHRHRAQKEEIARRAVSLVQADDVVFLDSSTTVLYLAREIMRSDRDRLTLVTNSVCVASEFHRFPRHMTLISIGGVYNSQLNSCLGGLARDALRGLRIGKTFLSAVGVSEHGIFTFHEDHASFLRELVEDSREAILLADSSKVGREALFRVCGLGALDAAVLDSGLTPEARAQLEAAGLRLWEGEGRP